jgi:hypothetical protein
MKLRVLIKKKNLNKIPYQTRKFKNKKKKITKLVVTTFSRLIWRLFWILIGYADFPIDLDI